MTRYARQYRRIGSALSRVALMKATFDERFELSERELLDKNAGRRFLDFYGDEGLRIAFERYGVFPELRTRGWSDFEIEMYAHDERHTMIVHGISGETRDRIVELVVRRDRLSIEAPEGYVLLRSWDVLTVDWLSLRNPRGAFTKDRLRLPGQDAPGLRIGERVLELLYRVVDRLGLDGMLTVPEYFHNAVLYARELPFVDPWYAGQLRALSQLLFEREKLSFSQAAWAMHWGHVRDVVDGAVRWSGEAMVHTHETELAAYLGSKEYALSVARTVEDLRYRLHRSAFDEEWEAKRASLLAPAEEA